MKQVVFTMVFAVLIFSGCARKPENAVAKVGKFYITADDLNKSMGPARFSSYEEELKARLNKLERLMEEKLIICAAYREKLDKDTSVVNRMETEKDRRMLTALYRVTVLDAPESKATEEEIAKAYERMGIEVNAKHILVKDKKLADSLYSLLKAGAIFDSLAAKFSEDPSNKMRGGDLGWFSATAMVKEFEDAAFSLNPGEISQPVKTQFGWHLILLVDKRPNERRKSLEEEKERIKTSLERMKQRELAQNFVENAKAGAGFVFNASAVKIIVDKFAAEGSARPIFTDQEKSIQLVTWKGGVWTIAQFDSALNSAPPFQPLQFKTPQDVENFVENALQMPILLAKAEEANIENSSAYKEIYTQDLERMMVGVYRNTKLYGEINVSPDEAKQYYEANKDSFIMQEQVNVIEIQVNTEKEAKNVIAKLKKGEDAKKLAEKLTQRTYVKAKGGELGPFTRNRFPELFDAAKQIQPGEVFPNPIPFQGKFSVIKLLDVIPQQYQPFEQVQRIVENKLKAKKRDEKFTAWKEASKKKYGYKIYQDAVEKSIDKSKYQTQPQSQ